MAVRYKHVMYLVPYISDSGALPPESCIFGQILNKHRRAAFGRSQHLDPIGLLVFPPLGVQPI
ncbi:hypothetical protein NQ318_018306 [Aromia moschata]|uniref:Uncharacterized protein n=1 Tax=Aromia moschata TaxID=1265417 RepID=A0AAV8ZF46_9CUCU|nr:hypothetical protein NQ318_018306 [Aromia moschata]